MCIYKQCIFCGGYGSMLIGGKIYECYLITAEKGKKANEKISNT